MDTNQIVAYFLSSYMQKVHFVMHLNQPGCQILTGLLETAKDTCCHGHVAAELPGHA